MIRASYSLLPLWRWGTLAGFVVFAGVAVFLFLPGQAASDKPPLIFSIIWTLIVLWNAYWWLLRTSYRLEIVDDRLRWATPLRHGEVKLANVRHIGPSAFSRQLSVIKLESGQSIMTMTRRGFSEFANELMKDSHLATFTQNGLERFQSKLSRGSGFRKSN